MVVVGSVAVAITLAIVASCVTVVEAQGFIKQPPAEFTKDSLPSHWVAEIRPPWPGAFRTGAQYAVAAKENGYTSLRSFLENYGPVCGNTLPTAKAKAIPSDNKVVFSRPIVQPGPCEIWLDDTLVYHHDDCKKLFGSSIPTFKVDFSSCKGSCLLRWYFLGLEAGGKRWQSYKNCVPVRAGKSRSIEDDVEDDELPPDEICDEDVIFNSEEDEPKVVSSINATSTAFKCKVERG